MPTPTDDGKTYTFKIRDGVKFHDGTPLTAEDVATSWQYIVDPPEGVTSAREAISSMVDKVEATDPKTVVFHLKFATTAFLPALADPFAFIYKKATLEKDPHWYEKNIMGSGPFKFAGYRDRPVDQGRAQSRLLQTGAAVSRRFCRASTRRSRRPASTRSAPTAPPTEFAACRPRPATS